MKIKTLSDTSLNKCSEDEIMSAYIAVESADLKLQEVVSEMNKFIRKQQFAGEVKDIVVSTEARIAHQTIMELNSMGVMKRLGITVVNDGVMATAETLQMVEIHCEGIISGTIEFIKKIIKAIVDSISAMFRWIGSLFGLKTGSGGGGGGGGGGRRVSDVGSSRIGRDYNKNLSECKREYQHSGRWFSDAETEAYFRELLDGLEYLDFETILASGDGDDNTPDDPFDPNGGGGSGGGGGGGGPTGPSGSTLVMDELAQVFGWKPEYGPRSLVGILIHMDASAINSKMKSLSSSARNHLISVLRFYIVNHCGPRYKNGPSAWSSAQISQIAGFVNEISDNIEVARSKPLEDAQRIIYETCVVIPNPNSTYGLENYSATLLKKETESSALDSATKFFDDKFVMINTLPGLANKVQSTIAVLETTIQQSWFQNIVRTEHGMEKYMTPVRETIKLLQKIYVACMQEIRSRAKRGRICAELFRVGNIIGAL